jgi:hypothetical protein
LGHDTLLLGWCMCVEARWTENLHGKLKDAIIVSILAGNSDVRLEHDMMESAGPQSFDVLALFLRYATWDWTGLLCPHTCMI